MSPHNQAAFNAGYPDLHRSTTGQWQDASYSNRLATAADFYVSAVKPNVRSISEIKPYAVNVESCITTASKGVRSMQTAEVAVLCMVQLEYF